MHPRSRSDPPIQLATTRGGRSPFTPVTSSPRGGSSQQCSLPHKCALHPAQSGSPAVNLSADRRTAQLSRPALPSQAYLPSDMSETDPPQNPDPETSLSSQFLLPSGTSVIDPRLFTLQAETAKMRQRCIEETERKADEKARAREATARQSALETAMDALSGITHTDRDQQAMSELLARCRRYEQQARDDQHDLAIVREEKKRLARDLNQDMDNLQQMVATLAHALQDRDSHISRLESDVRSIKLELHEAQDEQATLETRAIALSKEKDEAEAALSQATQEARDAQAILETRITALKTERDLAEAAVSRAPQVHSETYDLDQAEEDCKAALEEADHYKKEYNKCRQLLQNSIDDCDEAYEALSKSRQEIEALKLAVESTTGHQSSSGHDSSVRAGDHIDPSTCTMVLPANLSRTNASAPPPPSPPNTPQPRPNHQQSRETRSRRSLTLQTATTAALSAINTRLKRKAVAPPLLDVSTMPPISSGPGDEEMRKRRRSTRLASIQVKCEA